MLLAFDIGNTNITLGVYDEQVLLFTGRLATDNLTTPDQYAINIKDLLELHNCDYNDIEDCIIASVVPTVGATVKEAVSFLCDIVPLEIGPGIKTGLNIKIDNPAQLGADLPEDKAAETGKMQLADFIDPAVAEPFILIQAQFDESFAEEGR